MHPCRSQAQHGEVTLADTLAKASKASSELAALRAENQMLTQVCCCHNKDCACSQLRLC